MFNKTLFTTLAVTLGLACAGAAEPRPALDRFLADEGFCAYMVSYPDGESDEFMARFQAALDLAVSALRNKASEMTYTQAIFIVRAQCDAALSRP